jgi:hypothetical protein
MDMIDHAHEIQKLLSEYKTDELIELCEDYIIKNNITSDKIEINNNHYMKHYIISTNKYSLILIKWNKDIESKIHDHPEGGCIVRLLGGKLKEESYTCDMNNISQRTLYSGNFSYMKGKTILHRIIAIEDSISLHVYIPGLYKPIYYN